jgi:hypothetical protein
MQSCGNFDQIKYTWCQTSDLKIYCTATQRPGEVVLGFLMDFLDSHQAFKRNRGFDCPEDSGGMKARRPRKTYIVIREKC